MDRETTNGMGDCAAAPTATGLARSSERTSSNWSRRLRQTHRWVSIAFTLGVLVNGVAVAAGRYTTWIGLLAGFPLALLTLTGLYLFVLPYATRWRSRRRIAGENWRCT